jgi:hypothetical protein
MQERVARRTARRSRARFERDTMKIVFGVVMCSIASGCWVAEPASEEQGPGQPASELEARVQALDNAEAGTAATCRALMLRQRECSASFIPALVDARVERDEPPGTAAHARDVGREALLAEALDEWASDSRDDAIGAVCSEIAKAIAPARASELQTSVSACLQRVGCDAFVACAVPVNFGRWKG